NLFKYYKIKFNQIYKTPKYSHSIPNCFIKNNNNFRIVIKVYEELTKTNEIYKVLVKRRDANLDYLNKYLKKPNAYRKLIVTTRFNKELEFTQLSIEKHVEIMLIRTLIEAGMTPNNCETSSNVKALRKLSSENPQLKKVKFINFSVFNRELTIVRK